MTAVIERVLVPFRGDGSGVAELTWGQIGIWQAIARSGESRTMGGTAALPAPMTVEEAAAALRSVCSRHQALRTRLRFTEGRPQQVCSAEGEAVLEVVDVGDGDAGRVAAEVQERYQSEPFDYEHEWPVRMALVGKDGAYSHLVAVYLHLSMDAGGLAVLIDELVRRDPTTLPPVTAFSPLDQARQQQERSALRQSAASLRYLEHVLRTVPATRFGQPREGCEPGYRMIRFRSPATRLATDAIARRAGVSTSAVLLACFAVGVARFTGVGQVMAMLMVSNRFRPGFADSVSTIAQISPYLIDVGGISLGEAVARAGRSTMNAYKHAYYDPDAQDEVLARVVAERGEPVDYSCFYNDRRQADRVAADGADPTAAELAAAAERAEAHWEHEPGMPRQKLYLHVDDPADAIELTMSVDTRYFSPAETEAVVRGIEAVAIEATLDPGAPTGVPTQLPAIVGVHTTPGTGGAR